MCGVVLSAGASSRMGQDKALLPWPPAAIGTSSGDKTLLSAAIAALKPFTESVIVVAGNNADRIAPVIARTALRWYRILLPNADNSAHCRLAYAKFWRGVQCRHDYVGGLSSAEQSKHGEAERIVRSGVG